MAIQRIKSVALAVLRIEKNRPYYVKIVSPIVKGKKIDDKRDAAEICEVINMETGEHNTLVTSTVMRKELSEAYPNNGYVGKFFELSMSRRAGKEYNDCTVVEIGDPSEHFEAERQAAAKAKAEEAKAKAEEAKAKPSRPGGKDAGGV